MAIRTTISESMSTKSDLPADSFYFFNDRLGLLEFLFDFDKHELKPSSDYILQNPFNPSTATYYQITWTISNYSAGTYRFYMRGNVSADFGTRTYVGNGTFTHVMQSGGGGSAGFLFDARAALTASVDNIAMTEVTAEDASYADMCMQTGSSTYEWVNIVRNTY